jgi:hypothetical protein
MFSDVAPKPYCIQVLHNTPSLLALTNSSPVFSSDKSVSISISSLLYPPLNMCLYLALKENILKIKAIYRIMTALFLGLKHFNSCLHHPE